MLVEKSVYDAMLDKPHQDDQKYKGKKTIWQSTNYTKSKGKDYAIKHSILQGAYGGLSDEVAVDIKVPVDVSSINEGTHSFFQLTTWC